MHPPRPSLLAFLLLTASLCAAEPKPVITKTIALKAASLFRNSDPYSEDARSYLAILMQFAEQSPEVLVGISPKALPSLNNKHITVQERAILIAAFVVGNVDSQLVRGIKKDDPYAGSLQVIDTYGQMRKKRSRFSVPEIERLITLEKAGKLKAYLASK